MNFSMPKRGLIVREPWVSLLLDGTKTWELRGSRTSHRGPTGLISSGTGTVLGTALLEGVVGPLSRGDLAAAVSKHAVDRNWNDAPLPYANVFAWVFSDADRFAKPIAYNHKQGAVIWVKLG